MFPRQQYPKSEWRTPLHHPKAKPVEFSSFLAPLKVSNTVLYGSNHFKPILGAPAWMHLAHHLSEWLAIGRFDSEFPLDLTKGWMDSISCRADAFEESSCKTARNPASTGAGLFCAARVIPRYKWSGAKSGR